MNAKELRERLEQRWDDLNDPRLPDDAVLARAAIAALAEREAEVEGLREDAERWRYVRQYECIEVTYGEIVCLARGDSDSGSQNDAAIDAARKT